MDQPNVSEEMSDAICVLYISEQLEKRLHSEMIVGQSVEGHNSGERIDTAVKSNTLILSCNPNGKGRKQF